MLQITLYVKKVVKRHKYLLQQHDGGIDGDDEGEDYDDAPGIRLNTKQKISWLNIDNLDEELERINEVILHGMSLKADITNKNFITNGMSFSGKHLLAGSNILLGSSRQSNKSAKAKDTTKEKKCGVVGNV